MKRRAHIRTLSFSLLGVLCAAWAASEWDARVLRNELQALAEEKVFTLRETVRLVEGGNPSYDVTSVVTASRTAVLLGRPVGKITVYQRGKGAHDHAFVTVRGNSDPEPDQELEGNAEGLHFSGIEYVYAKVDGEWVNTESSACSSEQCRIEGRKAFEKAGV